METAFQSDIGQQRSENQDRVNNFFAAPNLQLVVIADGVGGNNGGNVAAEETVAALGRYFTQEAPKTAVSYTHLLGVNKKTAERK